MVPGHYRGQLLGRFRVLDLLGRGGMGEVYRARDEALGRDLAIKVLPPEVTDDPKRVERFVHEARAASALNHPHLTTIYEIGSDPVHYIAMELVQGRTLRQVVESTPPDLRLALDWFVQASEALGAAHGAGVVHRDIKPENVMIADAGYVKVLDFGIAKLRRDHAGAETSATRLELTDARVVLGTSGYMSPEQARGLASDQRTDIFSLGCVIYECVTGAAPFDALSIVERLHRVIHDEPAPIATLAPLVPAALVQIVQKCLAKDPGQRYQSMSDLTIDLRDVRREFETGTTRGGPDAAPSRQWRLRAAVLVAVVAVVGSLAIYLRGRSAASSGRVGVTSTVEQLTASGNTIDAAISPDGTRLAHVEAVGAAQSLWLRTLDTGEDRQLVPAGPFSYYGLSFSHDGRTLAYTTRGNGHSAGRLNRIPLAGGPSEVLLSTILTSVTYSPDGRLMAFLREQFPDQESSALVIANADGGGQRILATRRAPDSFVPAFFAGASWSPDGTTIVAATRNATTQRSRLLAVDPRTGTERELLTSSDDVTFTLWLPDGSGILFVARSFGAYVGLGGGQVWLKPYPTGPPRQVIKDLVDYRSLSVSADGRTVTTVGAAYRASLYGVPLDGSAPRRIPSERYDGVQGLTPLPDGSLIVTTSVKGRVQLIHLSADGARRTLLTSVGDNFQPAASPDGSTVVMGSNRDGEIGIWRMRVDGSDQRLLAHLPAAAWLSITPDGRRVIATSYPAGAASIWSIPLDGGQATEIGRQLDRSSVSPDGKWIGGVYLPRGNAENARPSAAVVPVDGSEPPRALATLVPATATGVLAWNKTSSALIASTSERFNLWSYDLAGGAPRQLTKLANEVFVSGALSADGKTIIAARGVFVRDVFTIRDFK